jgi:DNA-binding response OmpR family regulator
MRIMIIEDNLNLLELYTNVLSEEHVVLPFFHPGEAMEYYERNPIEIDLIIMDNQLPCKKGESVIFDIKSMNPAQKIVVVSGWPENVNLPEKFGVRKFAKPISSRDLKSIVEAV